MKANRWPTLQELKNSACAKINPHIFQEQNKSPKPSKFGNKKTEHLGIVFDSQKECDRYKELLLLLKTGHIGLLELQVKYELNKGGTHSFIYIADFVYFSYAMNKTIVEDVKGVLTAIYKKKRRLMKQIYGIEIKET